MKKEFTFNFELIATFEELSIDQQKVVLAANKAKEMAYAPYSKFKVGAALLLENHEIILGSNQENKAYPSGLCAERVALYSYGAIKREIPIQYIAITGEGSMLKEDEFFSPCGACRQAMAEYNSLQEKPFQIILQNKDGSFHIFESISHLLPFIFGEK